MTWTRSMAAGRIRERDNDIVYREFDAYNICFHTRTHCCYLTHICTWTPLVVLGMVWNMECRMEDYWRFICRCGCGWGISHKKNMILFSIRTWIIIFCYYFWEYDVFASHSALDNRSNEHFRQWREQRLLWFVFSSDVWTLIEFSEEQRAFWAFTQLISN